MQNLLRAVSLPNNASAQSQPPIVKPNGTTHEESRATEDLLVVSPYTSRAHLLDLTLLNHAQVLLAKALTILSPLTDAYATSPYISSFNWEAVVSLLAATARTGGFAWKEQFFYVIIFRSQVPPSTNRSDLAALDMRAHAEAMASGGLLKYWFGTPDADGRNLATCMCLFLPLLLMSV